MRYKIILEPATRVSFDFDDTLSTERGQQLALDEMNKGNQVWIITARQETDSAEVLKVADKLGIQHQHIVFTNGADKWKFMIITINYEELNEIYGGGWCSLSFNDGRPEYVYHTVESGVGVDRVYCEQLRCAGAYIGCTYSESPPPCPSN